MAMRWVGLTVSGLAAVIFFVAGPLALAFLSAVVFVGLLMRTLATGPASAQSKPRQRRSGRQSTVQTDYLDMILDHSSGQMAGRIRKGAFSGRDLSEMRPEELMAFWRECCARDEQSARVLESFLDRHHEGWREAAQAQDEAPRRSGRMTPREARKLLGVAESATVQEIRSAHRKLMREHHPDRGGSAELAAQLNEARDILLGS